MVGVLCFLPQMQFNRAKFFSGYRTVWGGLSQQQVNGLNFLLSAIENDQYITRIEWASYELATTKHETADTFQPIHEYGGHAYFVKRYGGQTALGKRLGNDTPEEGADYSGEGDVQLTGEGNYEKAEAALRQYYPEVVAEFEARTGKTFDLTVGDQANDKSDPENAGDPAIAYCIMSYGMRTGLFTGRKFTVKTDYKGWRAIINGTDKAGLIAGYAEKFEQILKTSTAVPLASTDSGTNKITSDIASATEPLDSANGTAADTPVTDPIIAPDPSAPATEGMVAQLGAKADRLAEFQTQVAKLNPLNYLPEIPTSWRTQLSVAWKQVILPLFSGLFAWLTGHWVEFAGLAVVLIAIGTYEWIDSRRRNNPKGAVPANMLATVATGQPTAPAAMAVTVQQTNEAPPV